MPIDIHVIFFEGRNEPRLVCSHSLGACKSRSMEFGSPLTYAAEGFDPTYASLDEVRSLPMLGDPSF